MKIMLDEGAKLPTRAHNTDAGLDLYSREQIGIMPHSAQIFDTGVHVQFPKNTVGFLKSKSGLSIKHGITSEGVIDEGYTGSIVVKLYNHSDDIYIVSEGDKITQLVILPIFKPELKIVDKFKKTARGNKGFGSSGK